MCNNIIFSRLFTISNFNKRLTVLVTILVDKAIGVFAVPTVLMELHQQQVYINEKIQVNSKELIFL